MEEFSLTKKRPVWIKKYGSWLKHVLSLKLCRAAPKLDGVTMKDPFADMGFIFLPNSLRAHVHDKEVPKWNLWDDSIPLNFFRFMDKILPDTGFLAILHSEEFEHTRKVREAADTKFKYFSSFKVLLPTPMFQEHVDVQVQILSLSIFSRKGNVSRLPRDPEFVVVFPREDLRNTTLLTNCLSKDQNPAFEFAGSARMSVGFMQRIIEYLTKPGDVVIDWTAGEGACFFAGDFCGRHVIGLEDRPIFDTTAECSMNDASVEPVLRKEKEKADPEMAAMAGPSTQKDLVDAFDQGWGDDLEEEKEDEGDEDEEE
ncbi:unnamed protein product [Calypogeia fissa]